MKKLMTALILLVSCQSAFAAGGSSTVGVVGPSARAMNAFDADEGVRAEVSQLMENGYKAVKRFPDVVKVERKNCHVPEGDNYVGGKATFTVCDSVFTMERDFKAPESVEIVKVKRFVEVGVKGVRVIKPE